MWYIICTLCSSLTIVIWLFLLKIEIGLSQDLKLFYSIIPIQKLHWIYIISTSKDFSKHFIDCDPEYYL